MAEAHAAARARSGANGTGPMKAPKETLVPTPLGPMRVWRKGRGRKVAYLAGLGGLPRWTPFLDKLAEGRRVVAPSLPGFPGGPTAEPLDDHLDWVAATHDALEAAGLVGADLVGASVGAALAAEFAALWPESVRRLVLIAPFGLFDARQPVADVFAQRPGARAALLASKPDALDAWLAPADGCDPVEWEVARLRADVAAAKILWPLGDTRLAKRLPRIGAPTLILWGADDRVVPPAYAQRFAELIGGPARIETIGRAGHAAEIDRPGAVARAVDRFLTA